MSISAARAIFALSATGTHTDVNTSGSATIGKSQTNIPFATADIAYSFRVQSTGGTDVATLALSSGVVTQTTGTPTITNGDGEDFQGVTLPTLVRLYAVLVESTTVASSCNMEFSAIAFFPDAPLKTGTTLLAISAAGETAPLGNLVLTFGATGSDIKITVIGKTA